MDRNVWLERGGLEMPGSDAEMLWWILTYVSVQSMPDKAIGDSTPWGSGFCPLTRAYVGVKMPDSDLA